MDPALSNDADTRASLSILRLASILGGLVALAAGIAVLFWPSETVKVVAVVAGIAFAIMGLGQILGAFAGRAPGSYWGLVLVHGLIDLAFGLILIFWTGPTVRVIVLLVGLSLLIGAAILVFAATQVPKESGLRSSFYLRAAVRVILGIILLAWPSATLHVIAILAGIYLLVIGLLLLFGGFQFGKAERQLAKES